jgi:hypothetical protein
MEDAGRVLNISSGLAWFSIPASSAYAMMKGGIAPGAIAIDFSGRLVRDNPEVSKRGLGRVGLRRTSAPSSRTCCARRTSGINGQRIEASGGMYL